MTKILLGKELAVAMLGAIGFPEKLVTSVVVGCEVDKTVEVTVKRILTRDEMLQVTELLRAEDGKR